MKSNDIQKKDKDNFNPDSESKYNNIDMAKSGTVKTGHGRFSRINMDLVNKNKD